MAEAGSGPGFGKTEAAEADTAEVEEEEAKSLARRDGATGLDTAPEGTALEGTALEGRWRGELLGGIHHENYNGPY